MKTEETNEPISTKAKIISLLQKANESIWMSSGLNKEFYNDPLIIQSIENSFRRVKNVKIIIDGDANLKKNEIGWLFKLSKELKNKVYIKQDNNILHWLIADGKHFRLEKQHEVGIVGVNNLFVCDAGPPAISESLKREFDRWWIAAKPVDF
jgi:phosphatidylserine/phosphatidylglycerophosphate/cardiolipin synthase-like enzyme